MLGVVASGTWLKVWPVSNFAQQLPTPRNNMQQSVKRTWRVAFAMNVIFNPNAKVIRIAHAYFTHYAVF